MKTIHFVVLLLVPYFLTCQVLTPTDATWHIQRSETTKTHYEVDKSIKLKAIDMAQINPTSMEMIVDLYYDESTDMPTKVIKTISSEGLFDEFMVQPETIVINKESVSAFSSKGKMVRSIPHSKEYLASSTRSSNNVFKKLGSENAYGTSLPPGFQSTTSPDGTVTMQNGNTTISINPGRMMYTVTKYDNLGKIKNSRLTKYTTVTSVRPEHDDPSDIIKVYEELSSEQILPSGACAKLVKRTIYTDYVIERILPSNIRNTSSASTTSNLIISPNPADNYIALKGLSSSEYAVTIFDIEGKIKIREQIVGQQTIDISKLTKGVFFIHVEGEKESINSKFVKL